MAFNKAPSNWLTGYDYTRSLSDPISSQISFTLSGDYTAESQDAMALIFRVTDEIFKRYEAKASTDRPIQWQSTAVVAQPTTGSPNSLKTITNKFILDAELFSGLAIPSLEVTITALDMVYTGYAYNAVSYSAPSGSVVTLTYSTDEGRTFSSTAPTARGSYIARIVATKGGRSGTARAGFTILKSTALITTESDVTMVYEDGTISINFLSNMNFQSVTSSNPAVVSVVSFTAGGAVVLQKNAVGAVEITATTEETSEYYATPGISSVTLTEKVATITTLPYLALSASNGNSQSFSITTNFTLTPARYALMVLTSSNTAVATISKGSAYPPEINIVGAGSCSITVLFPGDSVYGEATSTTALVTSGVTPVQAVAIAKAPSQNSFAPLAPGNYNYVGAWATNPLGIAEALYPANTVVSIVENLWNAELLVSIPTTYYYISKIFEGFNYVTQTALFPPNNPAEWELFDGTCEGGICVLSSSLDDGIVVTAPASPWVNGKAATIDIGMDADSNGVVDGQIPTLPYVFTITIADSAGTQGTTGTLATSFTNYYSSTWISFAVSGNIITATISSLPTSTNNGVVAGGILYATKAATGGLLRWEGQFAINYYLFGPRITLFASGANGVANSTYTQLNATTSLDTQTYSEWLESNDCCPHIMKIKPVSLDGASTQNISLTVTPSSCATFAFGALTKIVNSNDSVDLNIHQAGTIKLTATAGSYAAVRTLIAPKVSPVVTITFPTSPCPNESGTDYSGSIDMPFRGNIVVQVSPPTLAWDGNNSRLTVESSAESSGDLETDSKRLNGGFTSIEVTPRAAGESILNISLPETEKYKSFHITKNIRVKKPYLTFAPQPQSNFDILSQVISHDATGLLVGDGGFSPYYWGDPLTPSDHSRIVQLGPRGPKIRHRYHVPLTYHAYVQECLGAPWKVLDSPHKIPVMIRQNRERFFRQMQGTGNIPFSETPYYGYANLTGAVGTGGGDVNAAGSSAIILGKNNYLAPAGAINKCGNMTIPYTGCIRSPYYHIPNYYSFFSSDESSYHWYEPPFGYGGFPAAPTWWTTIEDYTKGQLVNGKPRSVVSDYIKQMTAPIAALVQTQQDGTAQSISMTYMANNQWDRHVGSDTNSLEVWARQQGEHGDKKPEVVTWGQNAWPYTTVAKTASELRIPQYLKNECAQFLASDYYTSGAAAAFSLGRVPYFTQGGKAVDYSDCGMSRNPLYYTTIVISSESFGLNGQVYKSSFHTDLGLDINTVFGTVAHLGQHDTDLGTYGNSNSSNATEYTTGYWQVRMEQDDQARLRGQYLYGHAWNSIYISGDLPYREGYLGEYFSLPDIPSYTFRAGDPTFPTPVSLGVGVDTPGWPPQTQGLLYGEVTADQATRIKGGDWLGVDFFNQNSTLSVKNAMDVNGFVDLTTGIEPT